MAKKKEFLDFPHPMAAAGITGHEAARRSFLDAWERRDRYGVHPVWIFSGAKGIGKASLAYALARRVFADASGRPEAAVAEQMKAGGIGDLFVLDMDSERAIAGHEKRAAISVELVRQMTEEMRMSSMGESWRVAIIDSLDELSGASPANALLKILEEPPAKTIFFLTAHSLEAALPTIRSRARIERLHPLSPLELRELASRLIPDADISDDLVKISGGSFARLAALSASGAGAALGDAMRLIKDRTATASDLLVMAKRLVAGGNAAAMLDMARMLGLAEMYPLAAARLAKAESLHLDADLVAFNILSEIRKCQIGL
jgi:DNA polymerase-3 subunit delta'